MEVGKRQRDGNGSEGDSGNDKDDCEDSGNGSDSAEVSEEQRGSSLVRVRILRISMRVQRRRGKSTDSG